MNKRGQKTKEIIKINFLKLIENREPDQITVSELCKFTGIHRKTFYSHYKNISDILDELYDNLVNELGVLYTEYLIGALNDFTMLFDYINHFIKNNFNYYSLLAKSKQYIIFVNRINKMFASNILTTYSQKFNNFGPIDKYSLFFLISGISSLYVNWISNPTQCPIEHISNVSIDMCNQIFKLSSKNSMEK